MGWNHGVLATSSMKRMATFHRLEKITTEQRSIILIFGCEQGCSLVCRIKRGILDFREVHGASDKGSGDCRGEIPIHKWMEMCGFLTTAVAMKQWRRIRWTSAKQINPGGKQCVLRDGVWNGKTQSMSFALGAPKGLRIVLEESGVNTNGMSGDEMREILRKHPDFSDKKSRVERFLLEKKNIPYMLPKFHSELNPIERVCA